ncbi:hypothetical protein ABTL42_19715, partial [Acinetobacter baumannii]
IAESDARAAKGKEAAPAPDASAKVAKKKDAPAKKTLEGDVEPSGGYASKLPDEDDDLPDNIVPDPCSDKDEVAKLPGAIVGV